MFDPSLEPPAVLRSRSAGAVQRRDPAMNRSVTVLATGPLTTLQDTGRPGQGALGVGRSGACDRASYRLANRLVGNPENAAVLEITFGGLQVRAEHDVVIVTTGARCHGARAHNAPMTLRSGQELRLGTPAGGLRTYLAIRGGFDTERTLGSRSTDVLSGLGPAPVAAGDVLAIGTPEHPAPAVDLAPVPDPATGSLTVRNRPRTTSGMVHRPGLGHPHRPRLHRDEREQPGRTPTRRPAPRAQPHR